VAEPECKVGRHPWRSFFGRLLACGGSHNRSDLAARIGFRRTQWTHSRGRRTVFWWYGQTLAMRREDHLWRRPATAD
jgi:hypothetical protein